MLLNNRKPTEHGQHDNAPVLKRVRKSVYKQAMLAGLLIILTVVILFAMTAAWYTNIVQSSGLVFEVSDWGFDGTVTLNQAGISAAPGDEGVVELIAESDSDELTAVSLTVSRTQMLEPMLKRIFFYIDTSRVRNGETMDRIYLNNQDSYTYLLFSKQTLMLTEQVHNDALLKWHWVYDVLGYYVQGTLLETVNPETGGITTSMNVAEYLRPIEYEYDEAWTTFDGRGQLLTTDGTTTVKEFLTALSMKDGYAGTIDVEDAVVTSDGRIYYPVEVNPANGTGVWAYLCTYGEIETNTVYDTQLGQEAAQGINPTYTATLTIAAQNTKMETVQVSTPAGLKSQIAQALVSGAKTVIQLADNITLTEPLVIGDAGSQQVMLDLNGKTLTVDPGDYNTNGAAIQVAAGSALTMTNGTLAGSGDGYAIDGAGAEITLSGVKINNVKRALNIRDNAESNTYHSDAKIRVVGCEIDTIDVSIMISGNGSDSVQTTQLVVEDSVIRSDYIGIAFNGSTNQWGTSTQILHSDVYGYWAGVYHPQGDADMVISNGSVISGYTGMVLKGGSATVLDSTIHGTGTAKEYASTPLSGFNDTGDGIYIETNYGSEILLTIDGNSLVTTEDRNALALHIFPDSNNVKATINSGKFSSDVTKYCGSGTQIIGPDDAGYYHVSTAVEQEVLTEIEVDTGNYENTFPGDTLLQGGSAWTEDEIIQPEGTLTEEPTTEEPATEEPTTEEPTTEEPTTEEPTTEEPTTEEPTTEDPTTEEPTTEEPTTEDPTTEEPTTEEPTTEEPTTEEPTTEEPTTEEPTTEEPTTEDPTTEDPTTEEPTTEEPTTEDPTTEEPTTEEPTTEEPTTEEPTTEEPSTEETPVMESEDASV